MKVYIAFEGDYSARGVVAVFSDKIKADECSGDVEEYELDEMADRTMHDVWEVRIRLDNGALISSRKSRLFEVRNYLRAYRISDRLGPSVGVSSISQEHALKLAAEDRQDYLRECALVAKPGIERVRDVMASQSADS